MFYCRLVPCQNPSQRRPGVHHQDSRRAQPEWQPRTLNAAANELLWRRTRAIARHALHTNHGVELVRSDTGERYVARSPAAGEGGLVVAGAPQELLLYVFGRMTTRWCSARATRKPLRRWKIVSRHELSLISRFTNYLRLP